jgi:ferric-dicitrate binding protein FerR (iron transport regulator)
MRRAKFTLGPWLLVFAVLLLPSRTNAQVGRGGSRVAGHITALMPEDHVLREEQTLAAAKDMILLWRDVVKTEKGGRVRIALSDGSVLNVGSDAELRIIKHDAKRQQTTLELLYGRLLATTVRIVKRSGKFDVRTPVAVAGVVGTQFGLRVDPESTDVVCREGAVRVRNADENVVGEVVLHAGEFTHVERGKPPSPPAPASPERLRAGDEATSIPNSP